MDKKIKLENIIIFGIALIVIYFLSSSLDLSTISLEDGNSLNIPSNAYPSQVEGFTTSNWWDGIGVSQKESYNYDCKSELGCYYTIDNCKTSRVDLVYISESIPFYTEGISIPFPSGTQNTNTAIMCPWTDGMPGLIQRVNFCGADNKCEGLVPLITSQSCMQRTIDKLYYWTGPENWYIGVRCEEKSNPSLPTNINIFEYVTMNVYHNLPNIIISGKQFEYSVVGALPNIEVTSRITQGTEVFEKTVFSDEFGIALFNYSQGLQLNGKANVESIITIPQTGGVTSITGELDFQESVGLDVIGKEIYYNNEPITLTASYTDPSGNLVSVDSITATTKIGEVSVLAKIDKETEGKYKISITTSEVGEATITVTAKKTEYLDKTEQHIAEIRTPFIKGTHNIPANLATGKQTLIINTYNPQNKLISVDSLLLTVDGNIVSMSSINSGEWLGSYDFEEGQHTIKINGIKEGWESYSDELSIISSVTGSNAGDVTEVGVFTTESEVGTGGVATSTIIIGIMLIGTLAGAYFILRRK